MSVFNYTKYNYNKKEYKMFGWLLFGTMTEFFNKPSVLPKEILKPYHKKTRERKKRTTKTTEA